VRGLPSAPSSSSGSALEGAADAEAGLVPVARARSIFAHYQRREGILVNVVAGVVAGCAVSAAVATTVAGGPVWGLASLLAGCMSTAFIADRWGLLGNRELARRLEGALGLDRRQWTFVGVCRGDQNRLAAKLFPPRVETDENVGFLRLESDRLVLRLEEATLEIRRGQIRDVRLEEVVEAPFLWWIRLEVYDEGEHLVSFLVMSREGHTLRQQRSANERLFEQIRDWHVTDKLRPLVEAGELSSTALDLE
jgi:hypothetical protein